MFDVVLLFLLVTLSLARAPYGFSVTPRVNGRIVGGKNTTITEHPYQVSFQISTTHICGGSIVAPNVIVTAAHCTDGMAGYLSLMRIRAGSTASNKGGQVLSVESIKDHPKYKKKNSFDYDCSVLVLKQPLTFNTEVQAIDIQNVDYEVATGTLATVTGWGALSSGGKFPIILQVVRVPKIDSQQCQKYYPLETISNRMHCFGYERGKKDACQGDSGGPLVVDGKLTGIVSWGYGCAFKKLPGVYTRVAHSEINKHITDVIAEYGKK